MNTTSAKPARIGRFEVRGLLGSGGFADVYRAYDPQLARDVAVKVVREGVLDDAGAVKRFLREGKVAARLCHPHIVSVFDAGQDSGRYYLAATFIDGETLAERLGRGKADWREAAALARDLAEALDHAHQTGVIHRDVKPANILLDARGAAYLADFGLAHVRESLDKLTQDGTVLGSPAYLAPELAAGKAGQPLPASDQYSLGAVLYEMLCGRPPFRGTPAQVLHDAIHTPPPPPRQRAADLPLDLETICLKALAKRPEDRYADCGALAGDLRRWLEGEPITARRLSLPERFARWAKREPKLAWTSLGAACGLLLAAVVPLVASVLLGAALAQEGKERTRLEEATNVARENAMQADEQRQKALEVAKQAEITTGKAEQAKRDAAEASRRLPEETKKQVEALAHLQLSERQLRRYQYVADVNLARQAFFERDKLQTLERLKSYQPAADQEDLRGFEWYHLIDRIQQRSLTPVPGGKQPGEIQFLRFKSDATGTLIAASVDRDGDDAVRVVCHHVADAEPPPPSTLNRYNVPFIATGKLSPVELGRAQRERLMIAPNGLTALTRGDGSLSHRLLDTNTDDTVLGLAKRKRPVTQASFSADGTRFVTIYTPEPDVYVWDTANRKDSAVLPVTGVQRVFLSPDGKTVATVSADPTRAGAARLQVWDVAARKEKFDAIDLKNPMACVAFAPRASLLAVDDGSGLVLWDLEADKKRPVLAKGERVHCLQFSPDGKWLSVVGARAEGSTVVRFLSRSEIGTGKEDYTVLLGAEAARGFPDLAYSPDGRLLAMADTKTGNVWVLEAATGRTRNVLPSLSAQCGTVAFSPKGELLAAGGGDGQVSLWQRSQFESGNTYLDGFVAGIPSLAVVPQGPVLAVPQGKTVHLLHPVTHFQLDVLPEQTAAVTCVASPGEGRTLVTGTEDGAVTMWDVAAKTPVVLSNAGSPVRSLVISRNGNTVAAGRKDGTLTLWNTATHKELPSPGPLQSPTPALALSPDGKLLAFTGDDNAVKLWDVTRQAVAGQLTGHKAPVTALAVDTEGKNLVTAAEDGAMKLWDLATRHEGVSLRGHAGAVRTVLFTPDGKTIASAGGEGVLKLWEVVTGQELGAFPVSRDRIPPLAFAPGGDILVSAVADKTLAFWTAWPRDQPVPAIAPDPPPNPHLFVERGRPIKGDFNAVTTVALTADGKSVALGDSVGNVSLFNVKSPQSRMFFKGHIDNVTVLAFSRDGQVLASGSRGDSTIRLWDVKTYKELASVKIAEGDTEGVNALAISGDGQTVATSDLNGSVKLWDVKTRTERNTGKPWRGGIEFLAFSGDGGTLASASRADGTVSLVDVKTGKERLALLGQTKGTTALAFSGDGQTVAAAGQNGGIQLWDARTGRSRPAPKGHAMAVTRLAFWGDGQTLAWSSKNVQEQAGPGGAEPFGPDGAREGQTMPFYGPEVVKLWDARTGQELIVRAMPAGFIGAFSDGGQTLVTWGEDVRILNADGDSVTDRTLRLWDVIRSQKRGLLPRDSR